MTETIHLFFTNGCQYYVAGRYAAFAGFASTVGNVLHHAIEHLLKGGLSKTKSLPELKQLGHNLPRLWEAFKTQVNDPALAQFDGVIATLHSQTKRRRALASDILFLLCNLRDRPSATGHGDCNG
jgi:hypothetical protein